MPHFPHKEPGITEPILSGAKYDAHANLYDPFHLRVNRSVTYRSEQIQMERNNADGPRAEPAKAADSRLLAIPLLLQYRQVE